MKVTTTEGKAFTEADVAQLAHLIYRRWGSDLEAAAVAYRRLMQNSCSLGQFSEMVRAHDARLPYPR